MIVVTLSETGFLVVRDTDTDQEVEIYVPGEKLEELWVMGLVEARQS